MKPLRTRTFASLLDDREPEAEPAAEIAVTLEMVEAGIAELAEFDRRFDDEADIVKHVYSAMVMATRH